MALPLGSKVGCHNGEERIERELESRERLIARGRLERAAVRPLVAVLEILQHRPVRCAAIDDAELEQRKLEQQQQLGLRIRRERRPDRAERLLDRIEQQLGEFAVEQLGVELVDALDLEDGRGELVQRRAYRSDGGGRGLRCRVVERRRCGDLCIGCVGVCGKLFRRRHSGCGKRWGRGGVGGQGRRSCHRVVRRASW